MELIIQYKEYSCIGYELLNKMRKNKKNNNNNKQELKLISFGASVSKFHEDESATLTFSDHLQKMCLREYYFFHNIFTQC